MEFATTAGLDWDAPPAVLPPLPRPQSPPATPNFSLLLYVSTGTSKHHHHVSDPHYRSMLNPHVSLDIIAAMGSLSRVERIASLPV
jgi:hypothetical protein